MTSCIPKTEEELSQEKSRIILRLQKQIEKMKNCQNCKFKHCNWSSERIDKEGKRTYHAWNEEKEEYCDIGNSKDAKYQCWELAE